jgi:hypothetical protein
MLKGSQLLGLDILRKYINNVYALYSTVQFVQCIILHIRIVGSLTPVKTTTKARSCFIVHMTPAARTVEQLTVYPLFAFQISESFYMYCWHILYLISYWYKYVAHYNLRKRFYDRSSRMCFLQFVNPLHSAIHVFIKIIYFLIFDHIFTLHYTE